MFAADGYVRFQGYKRLHAVSHRHNPTIGKGKLEDNYRGIPHWHQASIGLIFMLFTFSRGVSSGGPPHMS